MSGLCDAARFAVPSLQNFPKTREKLDMIIYVTSPGLTGPRCNEYDGFVLWCRLQNKRTRSRLYFGRHANNNRLQILQTFCHFCRNTYITLSLTMPEPPIFTPGLATCLLAYYSQVIHLTNLCVHIIPLEVRKQFMKFPWDTVLSSMEDLILWNFVKKHALALPRGAWKKLLAIARLQFFKGKCVSLNFPKNNLCITKSSSSVID